MKKLTWLWLVGFQWMIGCNSNDLVDAIQTKTPAQQDSAESLVGDDDDESIAYPVNISGAYLYCQIEQEADEVSNGLVGCALQDIESNRKINYGEKESLFSWDVKVNDSRISIETTRQVSNARWHVRHTVVGNDVNVVNNSLRSMIFTVQVPGQQEIETNVNEANDNIELGSIMFTPQPFLHWQENSGAPMPTNALTAGTEQGRQVELAICRSYHSDGIFPGKLRTHYVDNNYSVCFTAVNGVSHQSIDDSLQVAHKHEVLVVDAGDNFQWVAVNNGVIPEQAVVTGRLADGAALYSCRDLEGGQPSDPTRPANDPNGEYTPGYVSVDGGQCIYEFYGMKQSDNFEVLVKL
ncbi:DM9 repeat-containing protein [Pseudobacteriovorax antillogorgiicola]|uniref:Uncharacterized protein n=1 Tax=Pseudobacteriovorax antillogorgiicola TaxID=1513793 RepID=A0A1Y6BBN5_9BACT|nr:DM9 repeat-containing protein [Pseudobacteriovorax antillogorgiicola]TCS57374.1 uncharacterized protein DUF3421 [Pseudobacteriovorax antillogorgiicola]SMF01886.1 Protein of unknown function [Pseudobacteriovorax antillogorgiicola]